MLPRRLTATVLVSLLVLASLASVAVSQRQQQEQQGFVDAAGDFFSADIAGEPLPPLPRAFEDESPGGGEEEESAPTPAPAPAPTAAKRAPAPAPAAPPAAKNNEKKDSSSSPSLPYADLLYSVLARRATYDGRSKKLTLEGVFPIVAAVKTGRGDGRAPTSLKPQNKEPDCSALVSKTARRSTATRFFGDDFKRNGTWLNGPTALLMGTLPNRKGAAEIALRLTDVGYNPSASTVVFRAEQIDPVAARKDKNSAAARLLRSSGGVVDAWTSAVASSPGGGEGKWLDAGNNKVVLLDVLLDVDAPYTRQEHTLKGFAEG